MTKSKLSVYILLDRSSSMAGPKWESAIGSINSYVKTLQDEKIDAEITVAAFDSPAYSYGIKSNVFQVRNNPSSSSNISFDVLRNEVNIKNYSHIRHNEISPRGSTPLYDATAQLLNMADKKNNKKTIILIMTDGEENASHVYNIQSIKDRVATCTNRGWEVVFLGAEFNADNIARDYGLSLTKTVNSNINNLDYTMRSYGLASAHYAAGAISGIDTTSMRQNNK